MSKTSEKKYTGTDMLNAFLEGRRNPLENGKPPSSVMFKEWLEKYKSHKEVLGYTVKAVNEIRDKHGRVKKDAIGVIPCPKCGNNLNYRISSYNQHIWGKCSKDGCLSWME